jgi:hypothetical protein
MPRLTPPRPARPYRAVPRQALPCHAIPDLAATSRTSPDHAPLDSLDLSNLKQPKLRPIVTNADESA